MNTLEQIQGIANDELAKGRIVKVTNLSEDWLILVEGCYALHKREVVAVVNPSTPDHAAYELNIFPKKP
jgi:hypothetical protein